MANSQVRQFNMHSRGGNRREQCWAYGFRNDPPGESDFAPAPIFMANKKKITEKSTIEMAFI